jgi:hypothetical protein
MKEIPNEFLDWLQERGSDLVVTLDGYIKSAIFHPLADIKEVDLFVSVDEYIDNYSDDSDHLSGNYYPVPAFDLVAEIWGYPAEHVLVWLPSIRQFATFDDDHGVLRSFPDVSWNELASSLGKYIDCQWYPDRIPNELIRPWNDERFKKLTPTKNPPW